MVLSFPIDSVSEQISAINSEWTIPGEPNLLAISHRLHNSQINWRTGLKNNHLLGVVNELYTLIAVCNDLDCKCITDFQIVRYLIQFGQDNSAWFGPIFFIIIINIKFAVDVSTFHEERVVFDRKVLRCLHLDLNAISWFLYGEIDDCNRWLRTYSNDFNYLCT